MHRVYLSKDRNCAFHRDFKHNFDYLGKHLKVVGLSPNSIIEGKIL